MKKAYITPDVKAQTLEAQTMLASSTITASGTTGQVVTPGDIIHNGEFDTNKDVWGNIW